MPVPPRDPTKPHSRLELLLARGVASKPGAWFFVNVAQRIDPPLMRISGGRLRVALGQPIVLLTTRGAKSGIARTLPLLYFTDRDRVVLIASNGGAPRNPAWYHNVRANPDVTLWASGEPDRYVGHEAEGDERARLWDLACRLYPGYATYQERAGRRRIPVMVFEPAA